MILLIDNYDSFSYNLYQYIGSIYPRIRVVRNDALTLKEIRQMKPEAIVLSPGPGRPENAGICEDVVRSLGPEIPILGICLGHQAICQVFGARITYAKELMHGKTSQVMLGDSPIFEGISSPAQVARYHSLAADPGDFPQVLKVTAQTEDGEIMAASHREYPVYGLQFHPESVMTPEGKHMLKNFLRTAGIAVPADNCECPFGDTFMAMRPE